MANRPGNDDRSTGIGGTGGDEERGFASDASKQDTGAQQGGAPSRGRSNRGFASMDQRKQKEIASKGGRAAHAKGTAHEFDSSEAREAGRKGGQAVSRNREHMAMIGRRGGEARGHARQRAIAQTNTGATPGVGEGSFQNSRSGEREISLDNQNQGQGGSQGVNASPSGNRGGTAPLGGERRPDSQRDVGGNH